MSTEIQKKAVNQAVKFLQAAGAHYKIIFDNEVITNIAKGSKPLRFKKSGIAYKPHFKPFVDKLKEDGVHTVTIPVPEGIDIVKFRGAVAGYLYELFGSNSTITSIDRQKNVVEVLRA